MFSHCVIGSNDIEKAKKFYDSVLGALGYAEGNQMGERVMYSSAAGSFIVGKPLDGEPATVGNGSTLGFSVSSSEEIDKAHDAGVTNGGTSCEDPPGKRVFGNMEMYLAYLRDPDGNKLCLVHML